MRAAIAALFIFACAAEAQVFTVVHFSDPHQMAGISNVCNFIKTNKGAPLYIAGMVITGDCYEQQAVTPAIDLTSDYDSVITNGQFVIPIPGNHDGDLFEDISVTGGWYNDALPQMAWTNIFPVSWFSNQISSVSNLGFLGTATPGDSRQVAFVYTNGNTRLVIANYHATFTNAGTSEFVKAQFLPQTQWITNQLGQYPDHNGVVLTHYMLSYPVDVGFTNRVQYARFDHKDGTDLPAYTNLGPSTFAFDQGLYGASNLMMVLSGHTRFLKRHHIPVVQPDGGVVDVSIINNQSPNGTWARNTLVGLMQFNEATKKCAFSTINVTNSVVVTNWDERVTWFGRVYPHDWTIPYRVPRQRALFK